MRSTGVLAAAAFLLAFTAPAADNGLAEKPYMGWDAWSFFRGKATEANIKAQADVMAARLKPLGYTYINLDSGWSSEYDGYGRKKADALRFPSGILALADYVHAKGLKLGICLEPGMPKSVWDANSPILGTPYHARDIAEGDQNGNTLGKADRIDYTKPGAAEYVQSCADLVASWGVDFILMEHVGPGDGKVPADNRPDLQYWAVALRKAGRPIWLELSTSLDIHYIADWKKYSNGWRIEAGIQWAGAGRALTNWSRILPRFENAPKWAPFAGPGGWNDLDSLGIGNGDGDGLAPSERQTCITLWCVCSAPLPLGADLTTLDKEDFALLTNREVLAVDQAGRPALPVSQGSAQQVWRVENPDGSFTVALFNLGSEPATVIANWNEVGFHSPATVRDLWSHQELGISQKAFSARLNTHACRLLKVTPVLSASRQ